MARFKLPPANLRLRIIAWSFIPTTVILLAVALLIFYAYQQVTEDLVAGRNREVTRLSASQLASDLQEYTGLLSSLALRSDIRSDLPAVEQKALSAASNRLIVFDGGVCILNGRGQVVAAEPPRPEIIGQDWSNRKYFREMLRAKGPVFSDITFDGPGGSRGLVVAVPIMGDQGELRGMLTGIFRLGATTFSAFYGGIVKLRIGENGTTYLVDSDGRIIYHTEAELIGSDIHTQPVVQKALQRQVGDLRTRDVRGQDILATYAPVPGTPWGLVTEENWSSLLTSARGYEQFLLLLLALGIIVPTLVVTFGVKRIIDPLTQLSVAAREIAGGNFGQQITVRTGDELEELVKQFNRMSVQLSQSYGRLEERVAARTKELATVNAIAAVASQSLQLKQIMSDGLCKTLEAMEMDLGAAYCVEERDTGEEVSAYLKLVAQCGLSEEFSNAVIERPLRGSSVEAAAAARMPLVWRMEDHPEPHLRAILAQEQMRQGITVPLVVKGILVGALSLGAYKPRVISQEELSLLAAIGQQLGMAVENARLFDRAEQAAASAERTRLARELHDSVTQSLYSVMFYAEAAKNLLLEGDPSTAAEHLGELRDTAQEALREMRLLIFELRPLALEKNGLAAALQARLDAVEARGGLKAELLTEGQEHLPLVVQQELYHIAQEALNNVLKHSHCQHVRVQLLFSPERAILEICDDGMGFDPANPRKGGLGLAGIRERVCKIGASLTVESERGRGTRVSVQLPLSTASWTRADIITI